MKLLTHNMLASHVKGVKNGYPLGVLASQVVVKAVDFNAEFIARMIPKVDWGTLRTTAQSVSKSIILNRVSFFHGMVSIARPCYPLEALHASISMATVSVSPLRWQWCIMSHAGLYRILGASGK